MRVLGSDARGSTQRDSGFYLSCPPFALLSDKSYVLSLWYLMQQTKGKSDCFQLLNEREKAVVLVSITFVDIVLFSLFFFSFFFLPTLWFSYANGWSGLISAGSFVSRCNLTNCCSQSWLYGLSFQTLLLTLYTFLSYMCVKVQIRAWLLTCTRPYACL